MIAFFNPRRAAQLAAAVSVTLLSACQTSGPPPLYYWGDYEGQLYKQLLQKTAPQQQIDVLEKGIEIAKSRNMALPPGYYGQLGLLWAMQGQVDKARASFQTEEALFPEGKAYMDFLLKSGKTISSSATGDAAHPDDHAKGAEATSGVKVWAGATTVQKPRKTEADASRPSSNQD